MAYQTGTTSSIDNLISTLLTFLTANGWTQDDYTSGSNGSASAHKNNIFVHFLWEEATAGGLLAIYQSLGYISSGTDKWAHTDDSGGGSNITGGALEGGRCINQAAGPHASYFFFENDASPAYVHVVVEVSAGIFRHFGFGELDKIGDWTGGEYCYGHRWSQGATDIDVPEDDDHSIGLDGLQAGNSALLANTMHAEGLPDEPSASTKWGAFDQSNAQTDRGGTARLILLGGWRGGPHMHALSRYKISTLNAMKPLIPIPVIYRVTSTSPDKWFLLGYQKDVAMCNIGNLDPKTELILGSDTWTVFPWTRKRFLQDDAEESRNAGIAYRKVTA